MGYRDERSEHDITSTAAPAAPPSSVLVQAVRDALGGAVPTQAPPPCADHDPELWFAESPAVLERAKAVCFGCPVRAECLAGALWRHEPWGVWGGEIFVDGLVVAHKRGRGRPPKGDRLRERPAATRTPASRPPAATPRCPRPSLRHGLSCAGG